MREPEQFLLQPNDWVPNNQKLPTLLYRSAISPDHLDALSALEDLFTANGWPPDWRDTVWTHHHYHTRSHEALGVGLGTAKIMLGGPDGKIISVGVGDVIVLPAGTGHCLIEGSPDFQVVGAYPPGQACFDTCKEAPTNAQKRQIEDLPAAKTDPVRGSR